VCSNDIKPENVFLTNDPMVSERDNENPVFLADFGLAAFSDQEYYQMAGTTEYASPEIARIMLTHKHHHKEYFDCKNGDLWATVSLFLIPRPL
jgi:serine/threonine protein kinase